jgi:hypothetical protein
MQRITKKQEKHIQINQLKKLRWTPPGQKVKEKRRRYKKTQTNFLEMKTTMYYTKNTLHKINRG